MKSFVVMTYYQLMHAIAMTLEIGEKTNLYFNTDYLKINEEFLNKVRDTDVFNEVIGLYPDEYVTPYNASLKECQDMTPAQIDTIGNSIFENYLEPYFSKKFHNADIDDEIYVYNDFQRYFYYIAKHFKNIIGVEDGYGSLKQQLTVHVFKGNYKYVEPFLGKYYPEPLYKHKNVKKIISSRNFDSLPTYYKDKLLVIDFKDVVKRNSNNYIKAVTGIFNLDDIEITNEDVLILTTPLSRAKYCNSLQNYLFYKKLIEIEKSSGRKIYIKPHPADSLVTCELYEDEQVTILPKDFPVELLQYRGIKVERTISFASTASVEEIGRNNVILYKGANNVKAIGRYISRYISNEKLKLNIYVSVQEISPEIYINIMSYLREYQNVCLKVVIIVPTGKLNGYKKYLSFNHMKKMIKEYKKLYKNNEEKNIYCNEIENIEAIKGRNLKYASLDFVEVDTYDEEYIYEHVIKNDVFDYFMLLDAHNLGIKVIQKLVEALRSQIRFGYTFLNYTYRDENSLQKIYLMNGHIYNSLSGDLSNRLWHKNMVEALKSKKKTFYDSVIEIANKNSKHIQHRAILFLFIKNSKYLNIEDGKSYYEAKINECLKWSNRRGNVNIPGRISIYFSEYYNWVIQFLPTQKEGALSGLIESLNVNKDIIAESEKLFIEALLKERAIDRTRGVFHKIELYNYFNGPFRILFEKGVMRRLKIWIAKIKRIKLEFKTTFIKSKIKKLQKKVSNIFERKIGNYFQHKKNEKYIRTIRMKMDEFIESEICETPNNSVDLAVIDKLKKLNPKFKNENNEVLSEICNYLQVIQKKARMSIDETTDNEIVKVWTDFFKENKELIIGLFSVGHIQQAVRHLLVSNLNIHKINEFEALLVKYNSVFSSYYKSILYKSILTTYSGRLSIERYILPLFKSFNEDYVKYEKNVKNLTTFCSNMFFLSKELRIDILGQESKLRMLHKRICNRTDAWVYAFYNQFIKYGEYMELVQEWLSCIFVSDSHNVRYKKASAMFFARKEGKRVKRSNEDIYIKVENINGGGINTTIY